MKKIRLFCIPYAGGSAVVYNGWKIYLDNRIELVPIELAGRGVRFKEALYENMLDAVNDIYKMISSNLDEFPYAFYGHSMGSVIIFELCHKIMEMNHKEPVHIFVSGRNPPQIRKEEILNALPIEKFKEEIIKKGGTPKEVYQNKELFEVFIPILRADYRLVEEYEYIERNTRLNCNITVFNGKLDDTEYNDLLKWGKHTSGTSRINEFEGGHFFIQNHIKEITDIIGRTLINN